jgi:biotin carboxyl carrier protein
MKRTLMLGKEQQEVELTRQDGVITLIWNGERQIVDLLEVEPGCYSVIIDGRSVDVRLDAAKHPDPDIHAFRASLYDGAYEFALQDPRKALLAAAGGGASAGGTLTAPMPGKVVKLLVKEGESVQEGQTLLILEAMKMQNEYKSPSAGVVTKLYVGEGSTVETASAMAELKAAEA